MYQWCLVLHLLFVISWMCGLFYLPRFFVYHAEALQSGAKEACVWFVRMEKNLFRFTVVMLVAGLIFGVILSVMGQWYRSGWWWIKWLAVLCVLGYQLYCYRLMQAFARGHNKRSSRYYRFFNEIPVFLLLVILWMAVLKPW